MNLRRALAAGALRAYPRNFRRHFGHELLNDIEAQPGRFAYNLFEILKNGFVMRADDFARDLSYAVARLRRAPLFVAVVVSTFALGIGANVAVFSAFNAVVLRPLPFANADRLVTIGKRARGFTGPLTPLDVSDLRAQVHGVTSIAGVGQAQATMLIDGAPKTLKGANVGPAYFRTIGAAPQIGRFFEDSEGQRGRQAIVISDRIWRTYFNADLAAIGGRLTLDGTSYTVIGVTRPDAQAPEPAVGETSLAQPDYFTATAEVPASYERRYVVAGSIGAIAELAPDTTIAQLNAQLAVASSRVQALYPRQGEGAARITFVARRLADDVLGPAASGVWMVLAVAFGILLVACANVANVIGTRWSAREREVAVRRALGASTGRIAAQLFIETGVLAACGGVAGVAVAYAGIRLLPVTALSALPRADTIGIDATTLFYALLLVCLTTLVAGLAPVLALGRTDLQVVLSSAGRGGDASRGRLLRSALVIAEVAIALALVISSGLLVRSFVMLVHTPLGFRADGVYIAAFNASNTDDRKLWPQAAALQQRLLARVGVVPGVDAAALTVAIPIAVGAFGSVIPQVAGPRGPRGQAVHATANSVSPAYFRALGIPILRGRAFTGGDSMAAPPVAIVSQSFADAFFPGEEHLGQMVKDCAVCAPVSVVGIVPNVTQTLGQPPLPVIYTPIAQHPPPLFGIVVHAPHSDLPAARRELRAAFAAVFPGREPPEVYTVANIIAIKTRTQRFAATLLGALSLIPLFLALSGVYGVVSFSVAQRSREFGVRIALGARAASILADVLRRSLFTTAIGVAVGTIVAALDARAITPYLTAKPDFSASFAGLTPRLMVSPFDPVTFGIVIALIFACTAVAALIPAWRATHVDPVVALRYE